MKLVIKTTSENTVKALEVIKASATPMTLNEIAEAVGVNMNQILGGVVNLEKKGVLQSGETVVGEKKYKTYNTIEGIEVEFDLSDGKVNSGLLTEKQEKIVEILKANGDEPMTGAEIAEALNDGSVAIGVQGSITGLVKKLIAVRVEVQRGEKTYKAAKLI